MIKRLWQLHSWMGLIAGLGLLVAGVTGSLLVFAKELETLFNPEIMRVETVNGKRLPFDTLLARANRALSGYEITGWRLRHDEPDLADELWVVQHGSDQLQIAMLDPYTGNLLASPRNLTITITGWLLELHYTYFAGNTGIFITGIWAALLCGLGVTGIWLYRDFWGNLFRLRWRSSARIFFSDLHKMVGITSVIFNLILGVTGAYWNFTRVIGDLMQDEQLSPKVTRRVYADSVSLDALIVETAKRLPDFRANFISLPSEPEGGITLWGKVSSWNPLRSEYGSTMVFDAQTGAFKETNDIRKAGFWDQVLDMFVPLHFGTFGGITVKILWCLGGLAPGILAVSGSIIWWKRTRRSKAQKLTTDDPRIDVLAAGASTEKNE